VVLRFPPQFCGGVCRVDQACVSCYWARGNCSMILVPKLSNASLPCFRKTSHQGAGKAYQDCVAFLRQSASTDLARKKRTNSCSILRLTGMSEAMTRVPAVTVSYTLPSSGHLKLCWLDQSDSLPRYNNSNPLASWYFSKKPNLRRWPKRSPDVKDWFHSKKDRTPVVVRLCAKSRLGSMLSS